MTSTFSFEPERTQYFLHTLLALSSFVKTTSTHTSLLLNLPDLPPGLEVILRSTASPQVPTSTTHALFRERGHRCSVTDAGAFAGGGFFGAEWAPPRFFHPHPASRPMDLYERRGVPRPTWTPWSGALMRGRRFIASAPSQRVPAFSVCTDDHLDQLKIEEGISPLMRTAPTPCLPRDRGSAASAR